MTIPVEERSRPMNAEQLGSLQPALSAWIEPFRPCFKRAKQDARLGAFEAFWAASMKYGLGPMLASNPALPTKCHGRYNGEPGNSVVRCFTIWRLHGHF